MQRRDITQTYMNSCDLYIESVKMESKGYFYIVWKRGKKIAQTLKHQSEGKTTIIKQTLTLNITLQVKNGRSVQKNTILYVLDSQGKQIDQISLPVHKWYSEFSQIELPLSKGMLKAKVRRKQLMMMKNQMNMNSDNEDMESEEAQVNIMMTDSVGRNRTFLDSYKDEMSKIRKQLQDTLYFNNKLKNDRSVLISRNLQLEGELFNLKKTIKQQVQKLQKHYQNKIEIRQNIYEDQINNMILSINQSNEANMKIMTQLIEDDQGNRNRISILNKQNGRFRKQIEECEEKILEVENQRNHMQANIRNLQKQLDQLRAIYEGSLKTIEELNQNIFMLVQERDQRDRVIEMLNINITEIQAEKDQINKKLYDQTRENSLLREEIDRLNSIIEEMEAEAEHNKNQLQFTQQTWRHEKAENQQKQEVYRNHIKRLEDKVEELETQILEVSKSERENIPSITKEDEEKMQTQMEIMKKENHRLRQEISALDGQIRQMRNDHFQKNQENLNHIQQLQEQIEKLGQVPSSRPQSPARSQRSLRSMRENEVIRLDSPKGSDKGSKGGFDQGYYQAQIQRMNVESEKLRMENEKIKNENKKVMADFEFLNENAIKAEDHEALLEKLHELEQKILSYAENEIASPEKKQISFQKQRSFDNELGSIKQKRSDRSYRSGNSLRNKGQNILSTPLVSLEEYNAMVEAQQIYEEQIKAMKEQIKKAQQEKKKLISENQSTLKQFEKLNKQVTKMREQQAMQAQVVQYCDSEEEQNRKIQEQFGAEDVYSGEQISFEKERPRLHKHELSHANSETERKVEKQRVKKSSTINMNWEDYDNKFKKKNALENQVQIPQEMAESTIVKEQTNQQKAQKKNQKEEFYPIKYKIPDAQEEEEMNNSNQSKFRSQKNVIKNQDFLSNQGSMCSGKSFLSGKTMYKYQKVSHRQKIRRLEDDVSNLQMINQQLKEENQDLKRQINLTESQLKVIDEDRNTLKASLHFQLAKKNKLYHKQIQTDKSSLFNVADAGMQVKLPDEESEKIKQDYKRMKLENEQLKEKNESLKNLVETLKSQVENMQQKYNQLFTKYERLSQAQSQYLEKDNQFLQKMKEKQAYIKLITIKMEEYEKKYEHVIKKYEQKEKEIEKIKKQLQLKERQFKQDCQDLKLQKAQVQFELNNLQSDIKRYKLRIEELEDKLRKNDVMDILRQAQFESETANKKIVEMNRLIYQLKLEKDTVEDEVKLLKKKINDINKKLSEKEDLNERLQKSLDDMKRKQNRVKREIQDRQDAIQKHRDHIKRLGDEISTLKSYNTQYIFQKKKYIDELSSLQHSMQKKDYQALTLKKQIQRLKQKLQEKDEQRYDRKSNLRKQNEKLQQMLIEKDKDIMELQSIIKQLSNKLDLLTNENKRTMNQKSTSYSQKLRIYVDQIAQIRKVVDDNNYQINMLKQQLSETMDELEATRTNSSRLQQRLNEEIQTNQGLLSACENQRMEGDRTKEKLLMLQYEIDSLRNSVKVMKGQLDRQRKEHDTKKQLVEQLLRQNQQSLSLINKYKIRLSDYETSTQITKNLGDKLAMNDKQLQQLIREHRQLKINHDQYKAKYVHTPSELQSAVRKAQTKIREQTENTLNNMRMQHQNTFNNEKKKFEKEIIDLMNEVGRVKGESQNKSQHISSLEFKLSKLQMMPMKIQQMTGMYEQKCAQANKYRNFQIQNQSLRQKLKNLEQNATKLAKEKQQGLVEINDLKNANKNLQKYLDQLQFQTRSIGMENSQVQNKLKEYIQNQRNLKIQIQRLLDTNKAIQHEKQQIQRAMEQNRKENNRKITSLEDKIQQMGSTLNEHEKALQKHYEKNISDIQAELDDLCKEIQDKDRTIMDLEELVGKLEYDIEQYRRQIEKVKDHNQVEAEMLQIEFEKMKNKMADNQKNYQNSIKNMQSEMTEMSKEITRLKMRSNTSRNFTISGDNDINMTRLEEKCRLKDAKIEELKQNIFVLEQSVIKLKKKQTQLADAIEENQKLNKNNLALNSELTKVKEELKNLAAKDNSLYANLKAENNALKQKNQSMRLQMQQKNMQLQSLKYELQTTKELYVQLQKELDKRKNLFREKIEGQSHLNEQIHLKNQRILELQTEIQEFKQRLADKEQQVGKKNQIIANNEQKIKMLQISEKKLKNTLTIKANTEGQHYKNQINRLSEENDTLARNNKKLKEEISSLQKENYEAKTQISFNESSIGNLSSTVDELTLKCKQLEGIQMRMKILEDACYRFFNVGLDEGISKGLIQQQIDEKQFEINSLVEEIEELKFLNQRKFMDFDELKRDNYELQLRLDDAEFAMDQVDELRQICDKLEMEKKQAIFNQQAMRLQLESLLDFSSGNVRQKIEDTLRKLPRQQSVL